MSKLEEILRCSRDIKSAVQRELEGCIDISDDDVYELIDKKIRLKSAEIPLSLNDKLQIRKDVFNAMRRLDVLQDLLDDPTITEIMVNGTHSIFIERDGRLIDTGRCFESMDRLDDIIQQIVSGANRTVNAASPIVDARLKDGSRVNVVLNPISVNGSVLTIRRFSKNPIESIKLIQMGSINEEILTFLKHIVKAKYNILISGGTGAGKTTFLNLLSGFIPNDERIITIEDSAELRLQGISNLVSLEARNANVEGCNAISIRDLIKTSLRMRPDRVIVGEVRGEESIDMLQAMNVGQDGSMSTIHANSAKDALSRLETMMMLHTEIPITSLRRQIASGIDFIVHLGRLRDKSRKLLEINEVTGIENGEIMTKTIYEFREIEERNENITGTFIRSGKVINTDKLIKAGVLDEI